MRVGVTDFPLAQQGVALDKQGGHGLIGVAIFPSFGIDDCLSCHQGDGVEKLPVRRDGVRIGQVMDKAQLEILFSVAGGDMDKPRSRGVGHVVAGQQRGRAMILRIKGVPRVETDLPGEVVSLALDQHSCARDTRRHIGGRRIGGRDIGIDPCQEGLEQGLRDH